MSNRGGAHARLRPSAVCVHFPDDPDKARWGRLSGVEFEYYRVCRECREAWDIETRLRDLPGDLVDPENDEEELYALVGEPEILERRTALRFVHERVGFRGANHGTIVAIEPVDSSLEPMYLALTEDADILRIDFHTKAIERLLKIEESLDFADSPGSWLGKTTDEERAELRRRLEAVAEWIEASTRDRMHITRDISDAIADRDELGEKLSGEVAVTLRLSGDGRMAAVCKRRRRRGVVLDLSSGQITMGLDRGHSHESRSNFPVAFFEHRGRTLLVHQTARNRLDVSDPRTGDLLAGRDFETRPDGGPEFSYYHGTLLTSPGARWIADWGWVGHPYGKLLVWDLPRWLEDNVREPEYGPSVMALWAPAYFWDGPMCWIDDRTLAVWGLGPDADVLAPAAQIFDVEGGARLMAFGGPRGTFVFDRFLYSFCDDHGMTVWDVETGERVCRDPNLTPDGYHRPSRTFISVSSQGEFTLSRLVE